MKTFTEDQLRLLLNCAVCAGVEIARRIPNGAPAEHIEGEREEYVKTIMDGSIIVVDPNRYFFSSSGQEVFLLSADAPFPFEPAVQP